MRNKEDIQNKYYTFIKELNNLKESISSLNGIKNKQFTDIQSCFIKALENEINFASEEMKNAIDGTIWDRLTIAFLGETNAGKSTIIETFRILCDNSRVVNTDGLIVGDGRSDFTKQYEEYSLKIGNIPFTLIDVPGIEGNEKEYADGIKKALRRAHIVFYVHGDNNKPNRATASKIKEYLGDWVNVYTLYNVRSAPDCYEKANDRETLFSNSVLECEKLIRDRFTEVLGNVYKGNFTLQAFLAMCAFANFSPERRDLIKRQKIVFSFFGNDEALMNFSQFTPVLDFVYDKSQNYLEEIIKANAQKMISMAYRVICRLQITTKDNQETLKDFKDSLKRFRNEVVDTFGFTKNNIRNESSSKIRSVMYQLERDLCKIIDDGNDNKKVRADSCVTYRQRELKDAIPDIVIKNIRQLQSDIATKKHKLDESYSKNISMPYCDLKYRNEIFIDNALKNLDLEWSDVGRFVCDVAGGALCGAPFGGVIGAIIGGVLGGALHIARKLIYGDGGRSKAKAKVSESISNYKKDIEFETIKGLNKLFNSLDRSRDIIRDSITDELHALQELDDLIDNAMYKINEYANQIKLKL